MILSEVSQFLLQLAGVLMVDYVVQSMIISTTAEDRSRVIAAFKGHLQDSMSAYVHSYTKADQ